MPSEEDDQAIGHPRSRCKMMPRPPTNPRSKMASLGLRLADERSGLPSALTRRNRCAPTTRDRGYPRVGHRLEAAGHDDPCTRSLHCVPPRPEHAPRPPACASHGPPRRASTPSNSWSMWCATCPGRRASLDARDPAVRAAIAPGRLPTMPSRSPAHRAKCATPFTTLVHVALDDAARARNPVLSSRQRGSAKSAQAARVRHGAVPTGDPTLSSRTPR
jgi:hypothetical protein